MMARGRRRRPAWRARQGTASVEIVVMLPFFITLFAGIYYLHGLAMAVQQAGVASRSCVWAHAVAGCPKARPAICQNLNIDDAKVGEGGAGETSGSGAESDGQYEHASSEASSTFDKIANIPIVGAAVRAMFGKGVRITAQRGAPGFMGQDRVTMSRSNYVVCNTVPQSWEESVSELFSAITNW
jgi:hypothetical protein